MAKKGINAQLVDELIEVAESVGPGARGLVIDFALVSKFNHLKHARGMVLQRMDNAVAPFCKGDKAVLISQYASPLNRHDGSVFRDREKVLTLRNVYYRGEGSWAVSFDEISYRELVDEPPQIIKHPEYQASDFAKPQVQVPQDR